MGQRVLILALVLAVSLHALASVPQRATAQSLSPGQLAVMVTPPILLADNSSHSAVYVQLLGTDGIPRLAAQETEVALISSNPLVVRVPNRIQIPAGKSYATTTLTTTLAPGKATITAATADTSPASGEVTTVSAMAATLPLHLALYAAPGDLLAGGQPPGILSIVLLGDNGRTVAAPEELTVILTSSSPEVARVTEQVTIRQGTHFATTNVEPLAEGSAVLSALHPGFVSEFIEVHVHEPGTRPEALVLYLTPPVLHSESNNLTGAIIQAVDGKKRPVPFPCVPVHLASSSALTVDVASPAEVTCTSSLQYAVARLNAKLPGTAIVSASATGLRPAAAKMTVEGREPAQLKAYLAPERALSVEAAPGFIVAQVLDRDGLPFTAHGGIPLRLIRGGEALRSETVIPTGQSFVALGLDKLQAASQAEVWFVNPALTSAHVSVKLLTLPASAELTTSRAPLFPGNQVRVQVRAQSPSGSLRQAKLTWMATNGTLSSTISETDEKGEGEAVFVAGNPGDGSVTVTVSKPGYAEAKAQTQIAVVAPVKPSARPKLFGVPVLYLFVALPAILLGYLVYKLLPGLLRWT